MRRALAVGVAVLSGAALWGAGAVVALRLLRGEPAAPGGGDTGEAAQATGRVESEERAVLAHVPAGSRTATDEDAEAGPDRDEIARLCGGDYHPYFVRGDLDGDGRLDFAQAFVRERAGERLFDVAVFFGATSGGFRRPVLVETGLDLSAGDLSIDRSLLVVTPDLAGGDVLRYRWDAVRRRFVDADAASAEPDEESPAPSPDDRPRADV